MKLHDLVSLLVLNLTRLLSLFDVVVQNEI